ncbi:MAG: prolyl oligopeptidase family serine peptidase, partial [Candidatus Eisenbacteria bacterium]|nr:prolyl oligopeptidase family serine peptidase [Candidatus Eisenbacteria bacterium]
MEEVLICPGGDLYRSHLEADPIELQWVRGEFRLPTEGKVAANGETWLRAVADENGWIENEHLRNGHAFGNVTSEEDEIWLLEAMGYGKVYLRGGPRIGNVYGYTDDWQPWQPPFNFSVVPVELKQGPNHMYFSGSRFGLLRARFVQPQAALQINALDATLPDLVIGEKPNTVGSVVIMNCSNEFITKAKLQVSLDHQPVQSVDVPVIPPLGVRKVAFPIRSFETTKAGSHALEARVTQSGRDIHRATLELKAVKPNENRRVTFVSDIDGSVQFYGYLPAAGRANPKALFLSLHGAAVDARNQSGSYPPYTWGHVVAPTNRRPFGFNWEDWGRLDALEVLDLARQRYNIDPDRVYLTGHSMGGHGSWHLGTLYPDRFAAVGPSAGWISFWSYRPDQPVESEGVLEQMVQRATLPSRTLTMAPNLSDMGVYVLHGAEDDNVRVEQAHMMVERLKEFHKNFVFHEEPDVGHWWDLSDAPGADCVSWAPMFDYFSRHRLPRHKEIQRVQFMTPSPGVSSKHH